MQVLAPVLVLELVLVLAPLAVLVLEVSAWGPGSVLA